MSFFYYRVAVDVYHLFQLREHIGNKQSVIGGLGIIIAYGKIFGKLFKIFGDVIENYLAVGLLNRQHRLAVLRRQVGNENMKAVKSVLVGIFQYGLNGYCRKLDKIIVASIKKSVWFFRFSCSFFNLLL